MVDRGNRCFDRGVCSKLSTEDVIMVGECDSLDNEVLGFCRCASGDVGEYGREDEGEDGSGVD